MIVRDRAPQHSCQQIWKERLSSAIHKRKCKVARRMDSTSILRHSKKTKFSSRSRNNARNIRRPSCTIDAWKRSKCKKCWGPHNRCNDSVRCVGEGKMVRSRHVYTKSDERNMWMFIYEKLRNGDQIASEPKGLKIWRTFIEEYRVDRTADSLCTRFRRHMSNNLHLASLQCNVMMTLYKQLGLVIAPEIKSVLERKFSIEITLHLSGTLKAFKQIKRDPKKPLRADESLLTWNSVEDETSSNDISDDSSNSTLPPFKRSSLNFTQEIRDVIKTTCLQRRLHRLRNKSGTDVSAELSQREFADQGSKGKSPKSSRPNSPFDEDIVTVSSTSDSCQEAFDRLYSVFADGSNLDKTMVSRECSCQLPVCPESMASHEACDPTEEIEQLLERGRTLITEKLRSITSEQEKYKAECVALKSELVEASKKLDELNKYKEYAEKTIADYKFIVEDLKKRHATEKEFLHAKKKVLHAEVVIPWLVYVAYQTADPSWIESLVLSLEDQLDKLQCLASQ